MSRRTRQLTEAWLTILSAIAGPWVGWAMDAVPLRPTIVLSIVAGLSTAKAAFSEKPGEKAPKKTKEPKP